MWVERLNIVIRINFIEKVTFRKRFEVGKGMTMWISERRTFQGERRVRHRPQGEYVAGVQETAGMPAWLDWSEPG